MPENIQQQAQREMIDDAQHAPRPAQRIMQSRYRSECYSCGEPIERGETIAYSRQTGARHEGCPDVGGSPVPTRRERRAAKAERLRSWADGREEKADAAYEASRAAVAQIPFGQPILVGHHSEKGHRRDLARSRAAMDRTVEHGAKAREMRERADNIERQNRSAIYSDDPDATERLTEKIARLETQRDAIKAKNAAYRKEHAAELRAMTPYQRSQAVPFPPYVLTNLGANIRRLQQRMDSLAA